MFIAQPATSFGEQLNREFRSGNWTCAYVASAWVRRTGVTAIRKSIRKFLATGKIELVAGIDFSNTTVEGLTELVALEGFGQMRNFVYYNEAGAVFHPKVFLFSDGNRYALYVGSANLTGAGLYSNYEGILRFSGKTSDKNFKAASAAFAQWRDVSTGLSKRLTLELVAELHENQYIQTEESARKTRSASQSSGKRKKHIFGSAPVPRPPASSQKSPKVSGSLLSGSKPDLSITPISGDFWIQTGAMTSGSRNQLDLSMVSQHGRIPGSISFFKVNPAHVSSTSMITIRYQGIDYDQNPIKYPQNADGKTNGTWRLQMNGKSSSGLPLTIHSRGFRNKILHFRDIGSRHFEIVSVDPNQDLDKTIGKSVVWDVNRGKAGRHFGRF